MWNFHTAWWYRTHIFESLLFPSFSDYFLFYAIVLYSSSKQHKKFFGCAKKKLMSTDINTRQVYVHTHMCDTEKAPNAFNCTFPKRLSFSLDMLFFVLSRFKISSQKCLMAFQWVILCCLCSLQLDILRVDVKID